MHQRLPKNEQKDFGVLLNVSTPLGGYSRDRTLPALGTTVPDARLNVDGAVGVRHARPEGATHGYSLFFRNGFFETVKVLSSQRSTERGRLPSPDYEQDLITLLERLRAELDHIGVGREMTCMLSLTAANTVELGINRNNWNLDDYQGYFDRKTLVLPDVLLAGDVARYQALRPVFDLVWQSAGMEWSANYNVNGEWSPLR